MSSTIVVPDRERITNSVSEMAAQLVAVATAAQADINAADAGTSLALATKSVAGATTSRVARGVVTANVASLAAFTGVTGGSAFDTGVTCVAGDVVLLVNQTTPAQNGVYIVGTVAAGTAPLTRHPEFAAALPIELGTVIQVGAEGTLYGGSMWKAMTTGVKIWGTDDPNFYPKTCQGTVTLGGNPSIKAVGSTQGLWLFSTTLCSVHVTLNTAAGTLGTWGYAAPVVNRTAGKVGTAAMTIASIVDAGTGATADTSTVDFLVTNW